MLTLSSIAGWERAIAASVRGATGTIAERDQQLERSGLYGEYPAILNAYIDLFNEPSSSLEALKRALFIVWYAAVEVPTISGIAELPDRSVRTVIEELGARLRSGDADEELHWMLAWYHAHGAHLFEMYVAEPSVERAAREAGPDSWRHARPTQASLRERGQLGDYWRAMFADES
jgi:hypothetical protein